MLEKHPAAKLSMARRRWPTICLGMVDDTERLRTLPAFQAVLYPNRSLGDRGFAVLMGLIVLVCSLVGTGFALVGAWPVSGFLGLDVLLIYLAFRWSFRETSRADFITLDDDGLSVRRIMPSGEAKSWRFETAWVQVLIEGRRLILRSHGQELAIGPYLTIEERRTFASALKEAIQARRNTIDHP